MWHILWRTIVFSWVRFIGIIALLVFAQRFEVSPLPDWTLTVFVYLMQFVITWKAAEHVFKSRKPDTRAVAVVTVGFIALEWLYESLFYVTFIDRTWRQAIGQVTAWTFLVFLVYAFAVVFAAHRAQKKSDQAVG